MYMNNLNLVKYKKENEEAVLPIFIEAFREKLAGIFKTDAEIIELIQRFNFIDDHKESGFFVAQDNNIKAVVSIRDKNNYLSNVKITLGKFKGYSLKTIYKLLWMNIALDHNPKENELYIDTLAVHKEFQEQGIGSFVLKTIIDAAKEKGYKRVSLHVIIENEKAKKLYEKFGFKIVKTLESKFFKKYTKYTGNYLMYLDI